MAANGEYLEGRKFIDRPAWNKFPPHRYRGENILLKLNTKAEH